jgi:hypothetical protein
LYFVAISFVHSNKLSVYFGPFHVIDVTGNFSTYSFFLAFFPASSSEKRSFHSTKSSSSFVTKLYQMPLENELRTLAIASSVVDRSLPSQLETGS